MGTDPIEAVEVSVRGKVQGVYYRASAFKEAQKLGLYGSVRNCDDGSVLLKLQGAPTKIKLMLEWCAKGPTLARVNQISTQPIAIEDRGEFRIIY